jgi:Ca2+-binding EF-hand superfamily protein
MAFESYDVDSSNALDLTEFRAALSDLGINPKEEDFEALVEEIDEDHSRTLDLSEFKRTATMLGLPLGRVARTKVRLQISVLVSVGWLFLGMFAVRAIEGWAYIDSFYFSVMTLTTVGLGDFVPTSQAGTVFGFFYCMVGLGLIALLVTAIGDFSDAVRNKAEQKAAAAVVAAASRAARELHAVGQSTGKLLNKTSDRLHKNQTGGWRSGRSSPTAAALALAAGDGKDQEEEEDTLAGRIMQTQQIDATDERSEMHGVHGMMGRLTEDAPVRMDGTAVPVLTEAEEKADDIMDAFDKNNDGVLDASEVVRTVLHCTALHCTALHCTVQAPLIEISCCCVLVLLRRRLLV